MKTKTSTICLRVIAILALLLGLGLIYYLFSPENRDFFPPCPFHYITGFECPGCGSQRATHHLLHFRIREAFSFNPLLVISLPYLAVAIYFEYMGGKRRHLAARKMLFGQKAIFIIATIFILYWIGRNMPIFNQ